MTRDQAIAQLVSATERNADPIKKDGAAQLIQALEVLGLLKIDRTPGEEGARFVAQMARSWVHSAVNSAGRLAEAINYDLDAAGFEIRRKAP